MVPNGFPWVFELVLIPTRSHSIMVRIPSSGLHHSLDLSSLRPQRGHVEPVGSLNAARLLLVNVCKYLAGTRFTAPLRDEVRRVLIVATVCSLQQTGSKCRNVQPIQTPRIPPPRTTRKVSEWNLAADAAWGTIRRSRQPEIPVSKQQQAQVCRIGCSETVALIKR